MQQRRPADDPAFAFVQVLKDVELQLGEIGASAVEDELTAVGIEQGVIVDEHFPRGEIGQPAVDRGRPGVVVEGVVRGPRDVGGAVRETGEAERRELGQRGGGIGGQRVDAPEPGPHFQVTPLEVEDQGGVGRGGGFAAVGGQHVAQEEHLLSARHRVGTQVLAPSGGHRVRGDQPGRHGGRLAQALERGRGPVSVPGDAERGRHRVPPGPHHGDGPGVLVGPGDRGDLGFIGRPGPLDRVPVAGGVQLAPQLPPRRDPVGAVGRRIVDPQRRDDFAHGVEAGQVDPGEFGDDGGDRRVGDGESVAAQQRAGVGGGQVASGTVTSRSPNSLIQAATGGSRPASASRVLSRRPGTSSWRSQVSSSRSCL